jgi:DNA modification methylase
MWTDHAFLHLGDCLEALATLPESSIDAVVTDPPYHLTQVSRGGSPRKNDPESPFGRHHIGERGFMGRVWDGGDVAFRPETWAEILRVAKPGAHLLAFGGTRTWHRLACAIEDAGWEIRDTIMWVYGTGFPKSLNVQQAINKAARGVPQGVADPKSPNHGKFKGGCSVESPNGRGFGAGAGAFMQEQGVRRGDDEGPWNGWGTALKPAVEYIVCATKPLDLQGLCERLAFKIGDSVCQLRLCVKAAVNDSSSNQKEYDAGADFARWRVVPPFSTPADLFAAMDTLRCVSDLPLSLSTALSWLDLLGALSEIGSTFTTETKTSLITDLEILNSSSAAITPESIIAASTIQRGIGSNALLAASIFNVVSAKLVNILGASAPGLATSLDGHPGLRPNWLPIILARKPPEGTVAANVLKHGTGGINIDGCRIETNENLNGGAYSGGIRPTSLPGDARPAATRSYAKRRDPEDFKQPPGRWPANLVHDGSDEVLAAFPVTTSGLLSPHHKRGEQVNVFGKSNGASPSREFGNDVGSAARFFYCAKASKSDRGEGNNHPTVKPQALMRWLVRLVTPPGGMVLDPFMGSGTTGVAALLEKLDFMGIEKEDDAFHISEKRISRAFSGGQPEVTRANTDNEAAPPGSG